MTRKLYFLDLDDEEFCYPLSVIKEMMQDRMIRTVTLIEAVLDKSGNYFFCRAIGEAGDSSEGTCGKSCPDYEPCNGKSGKCKHRGYTYDQTGKTRTITIKLKEAKNERQETKRI